MSLDPDLWRSASHRNMAAHLTGPFAAGAVDAPIALAIGAGGARVIVDWASREPLLLAAPAAPLGGHALRLDITLDPDGTATELPSLLFAPYTEAGAFLPLHRPPVDPATRHATQFVVALELVELAEDGTESDVAAPQVADRIEIRLIEGVMGRLIYLLGAEKQRLRRQARELASMRLLASARDDALDRLGAELGVPRLADNLVFQNNQIATENRREPDEEYRRRLGIYRPFLLPSRRHLLELLNGPGTDADPNRGLLRALRFTPRFHLPEDNNPFAIAIHLVSAGDGAFRDNFLEFIRKVYLIWPQDIEETDKVHASRYLPTAQRQRVSELRARLRALFAFPTTAAIAPLLATALDRAGRCREALGQLAPWPVLRAHDAAAGSRYELGLGVDLKPLTAKELNAMGVALKDPKRSRTAPEVEALLAAMTPRPAAEDPEGRWLLEACGLRTVHRVDNGRIYLSHLPAFGMAITGASNANPGAELPLEVRFHTPGDSGSNVVLAAGLQAALIGWTAAGGAAWTAMTDADARTRWDKATPRPADDPVLNIFRAAGLPAVEKPAPVVERLKRLPEELIETIQLDAALAERITNGDPAAIHELRRVVAILRRQNLSSALPLITGPKEVVLVVGVIGLPESGINLADRRATGFRWYVVPIQGKGGQVKSVGSRTVFVPSGPGLSALVALGYARRGMTDPYEFRVELPDGEMLSLLQYEFLMNLLDHIFPIGVEVNTFSIRREHVDLDDDKIADPLLPTASRTFRRFRRPRAHGEFGVMLEES